LLKKISFSKKEFLDTKAINFFTDWDNHLEEKMRPLCFHQLYFEFTGKFYVYIRHGEGHESMKMMAENEI
jgi:hypothetical protein